MDHEHQTSLGPDQSPPDSIQGQSGNAGTRRPSPSEVFVDPPVMEAHIRISPDKPMQIVDALGGNKLAIEARESLKDLIELATDWKRAIQELVESLATDSKDLKKNLSDIVDGMTVAISDHNNSLSETTTNLTKDQSDPNVEMNHLNTSENPAQSSLEPIEFDKQKKQKRISTEYIDDVQHRALYVYKEDPLQVANAQSPEATRSAGWVSQRFPQIIPPISTFQSPLPPRQRSVGGEWKGANVDASWSKRLSLLSGEPSPDTPQRDCNGPDRVDRSSIFWARQRRSVTIPECLSEDSSNSASPDHSRVKASQLGIASRSASRELLQVAEAEQLVHPSGGAWKHSLPGHGHATFGMAMYKSKEDRTFDQEPDAEGLEEATNRDSSGLQRHKPKRLSHRNSYMPDGTTPNRTSMVIFAGGKEQQFGREQDEECSETTASDAFHFAQSPIFGPEKNTRGLSVGMLVLAVAYCSLLFVTIQVYVASLRQRQIWFTANGLTREYMLRTYLETPSWMSVPGVDGNLVLGFNEAEKVMTWLWQVLSWNSSVDYSNRWLCEIDGM